MEKESELKACVACAEQIQSNARLCKHCKTRQDDPDFVQSDETQDLPERKREPWKASPVWSAEVANSTTPSQTAEKSEASTAKGKGFWVATVSGLVGLILVFISLQSGQESSMDLDSWKGAATAKALELLRQGSYSRDQLLEELIEAGFTEALASAVVQESAFNWEQEAVDAANVYVMESEFFDGTRENLIRHLVLGKKFSENEAASAATAIGLVVEGGNTAESLILNQLSKLNSGNDNGNWFKGSPDLIGESIGILLDNYGDIETGCAIWFYESEAKAQEALAQGQINLFSDFHEMWVYDSGPAFILIASSASELCYSDALERLELIP